MSDHVFRNPDLVQQLPDRDYIRANCLGAKDGLVVTDLDMVIDLFGPLVGRHRDADGRLMLVEKKMTGHGLNKAQGKVLSLMHKLMRKADPKREFYVGCYLLHWDYTKNVPTHINWKPVTEQQFKDWMHGKMEIPSLFDGEGR